MTDVNQARILVVEDDRELAQWTCDYLSSKGFVTETTASGRDAVERILSYPPDLVILDGMLPDLDGLDVCRQVRHQYKGPVIMLTARDEEIDEVLGLEVGADDYITKPVRARVLLARIRGQLRRSEQLASGEAEPQRKPNQIVLAGLTIDKDSRSVQLNGQAISVTSNEFDVLWLLAGKAGSVVSREELVRQLRGIDYDGFDRSVDLRISRLRKKLGDNSQEPFLIKTIWGKGYLFARDAW